MLPNALYGAHAGSELPPPPPLAELELLELPHAVSSSPTAASPATAVADLCLRTPMGSASLKGRLSGFGRPSTGPSSRDVNPSRRPCATQTAQGCVTIAQPWRGACSVRKRPSVDPRHRRHR